MMHKIYSIEEITERITPIAKRYELKAVYLFGSYARGDADENSDIDLIVDTQGTDLNTLMKLGGLYMELEEAFEKPIDLITVASLMQPEKTTTEAAFRKNIWKEKVNVYATA